MNKPTLIAKILHIGLSTYYKYVKNDVKIVKFLQSFSMEELEELNKVGMISSINFALELVDEISESQKYKILENAKDFEKLEDYFILFYFDFLCELKKATENQSNIDDITFSSNFYLSEFNNLFLTYFNYFNLTKKESTTKKELLLKTNIIYQNSKIFFKDWDKNTLYFLYFSLKENFKNLYKVEDDLLHKKTALWHIICLHVFCSDQTDESKVKKMHEYMSKFHKLSSTAKISNSLKTLLNKLDITI